MRTLISTLLLIATLALPLRGNAETIILVADSWCPYNCNEGNSAPGYLIEIATEAFALSGYSVTYEEMNWTRAIYRVRKGRAQGLVGATMAEVPDFVFPEKWLGLGPNAYFTLTTSRWKPTDKDALSKVRLGIVRDYDYGPKMNAWIEAHKDTPLVQEAPGENALETNLLKLQYSRIDVVVDQKAAVLAKAKEMGLEKTIRFAGEDPIIPAEDRLYIAFSPVDPRSRKFATALDDGVTALRKSGRLTSILKKYGMEDWE
ncbi:transporter substrate-binding domain-containing protein [Desulfovibrio mangrovi]|uniref:substrate-binding periplasmic protein n=1 Tax=Desulfovibrio mangrovi TaxID=2976983 RepID=UPI002247F176|nr:transporter substrate-binding domain-containing protein [Desulfovibrio mangrovi]UZP68002.1 transporter substrate-binding domain-containing protein [Desulfovibrio mangrovi]